MDTLRQIFYVAALMVVCTIGITLTLGLLKVIVDFVSPLP